MPTVVRLKGAEVVCTLLCEVTISSICKSFVFFHPLESWGVSNPYQSYLYLKNVSAVFWMLALPGEKKLFASN